MRTPAWDTDSGALLSVWVVPNASRSQVVGVHDGSVKVRVASPPEDGKANRELTRLLQHEIGRDVKLVHGITSRKKVFEIAGADAEHIMRKLGLDL